MNVCMIAYSFYEADNRVMRYAEALASRGDRVDVIALQSGNRPAREILNGVNLFRIQERSYKEKTKISYLLNIALFFLEGYPVRRISGPEASIPIGSCALVDLVFTAIIPKVRGAKIVLDIHDILPEFYMSKFGAGTD